VHCSFPSACTASSSAASVLGFPLVAYQAGGREGVLSSLAPQTCVITTHKHMHTPPQGVLTSLHSFHSPERPLTQHCEAINTVTSLSLSGISAQISKPCLSSIADCVVLRSVIAARLCCWLRAREEDVRVCGLGVCERVCVCVGGAGVCE